MTGYKEIVISFFIGLGVLALCLYPVDVFRSVYRPSVTQQPTPLQGRSEDSALSFSWGLDAIHAREARAARLGNRDIVVAVIDTGCDIHHPDLAGNIWTNPGETGLDENGNPKSSNGIDDDGNGFADDVHGWNFVNNNPGVMDDHGHGTHIAGIIGSTSAGVAPRVSLMILKYYDENTSGEQNLHNTVEAIYYAVKMGADIVNYSGGGIFRSREEEAALSYAAARGVLVVAAAGNEGLNSDFFHFYPADYDLNNIISVAATDRLGRLLNVSNFGKVTVDIAAPGKNIYSTLPQNTHGYMSGTSQATAFVTGLAALLMAENANLRRRPGLLGRHILDSGRRLPHLRGRLRSEALLDVARAVAGANPANSLVRFARAE